MRAVDVPVRILSVTGTSTARTTASRMRATRRSSRSRAEPAALRQTFFAGQPMLMSTIWAPRSAWRRAASAMRPGSLPTICTARGGGSPAMSSRARVFAVAHRVVSAVTISAGASAAP